MGRLLLVVLVAECVFCGAASAGTITVVRGVESVPGPHNSTTDYPYAVATYSAAAGEANDVTMSGLDKAVAVHDAGAAVAAGDGCEQLGEHDARCTVTNVPLSGAVKAGDSPDTVTLSTEYGLASLYARGGAGDDRLVVANGATYLYGDDGDDTLL